MRNPITTLCLTLAVIVGSAEMSGCNSGYPWSNLFTSTKGVSAGFWKGVNAYQNRDYATALREWEPLAKHGDAQAQNNMGFMYEIGRGIPQNDETAMKWYKHSAKQGNAFAQYNLGVTYDEGVRVLQNFKTAVNWYRLAANQEHAGAQNNLGVMYQETNQADKAINQYIKVLKKDKNHWRSLTNLGLLRKDAKRSLGFI